MPDIFKYTKAMLWTTCAFINENIGVISGMRELFTAKQVQARQDFILWLFLFNTVYPIILMKLYG